MAIPNKHVQDADEALGENALHRPQLQQHKLINILTAEMDKRHKKFFLYGALENKTLVFYFSHNAIALEFRKDLEAFRKRIIPLYKEHEMQKRLLFTKMEAKVKNRALDRKEDKPIDKDKSSGDFKILAKDEGIVAMFTKIKNNIKEHQ